MKDLLAQGFVGLRASPYSVPILFVPKKDGKWRMSIDYKILNKQIVKNQILHSRIDSLLERLGQANAFAKLDPHIWLQPKCNGRDVYIENSF